MNGQELQTTLNRVDGNVSEMHRWVNQEHLERAREQERLRTIKWGEIFPPIQDPATTFTLPESLSPDAGYLRDIRLITVTLSASDSVAVYKGTSANGRCVGYAPAPGASPAQPICEIVLSKDVLWRDGEQLFFTTSGTGNITFIYLTYWQAAAEQQGKLH